MLAMVELGSGALAGLIAILVTVLLLAVIASRMMRRDVLVRIAKIGVFVQRERLPTPSDEVAKPEVVDESLDVETQQWPQRPDDA